MSRTPEGTTVLVVDDEADIRTLCKVNLEYEGYRVVEAEEGKEALEMIKSEKPDIIILDIMMPGMDGWEVMRQLHESAETAKIPVVLLTALADEESQLKGWDEGVLDYVTKPFNPLSLSRFVAEALKDRDPEEEERRRAQIVQRLRKMKDLKKQE